MTESELATASVQCPTPEVQSATFQSAQPATPVVFPQHQKTITMAEGAPTDAAAPAAAATPTSAAQLPGDLLADVEREHALADLQASLKASEERIEKLSADNKTLETERDGAGRSLGMDVVLTIHSVHFQPAPITARIAPERTPAELLRDERHPESHRCKLVDPLMS